MSATRRKAAFIGMSKPSPKQAAPSATEITCASTAWFMEHTVRPLKPMEEAYHKVRRPTLALQGPRRQRRQNHVATPR